jgi:hypothetical protein
MYSSQRLHSKLILLLLLLLLKNVILIEMSSVFVNEFFAESWVRAAIELVALGKDKPDAATKAFIRDCQTQSKTISYFCGTALVCS